jgi:Kdo2-lipid IVA lauroyltransferase/acyltransferase
MKFRSEQIVFLKSYIAALKPTWMGKFAYWFFPFRKKVVLDNLRLVFDSILEPQEITLLAQAFYSHMFKSIKETLLLRLIPLEQLKKKVEIKGLEHMWTLLEQDVKGAILITGHFGSWEFAPIAGMAHFPEFRGRFYFVRKMLSLKWLEKLLFNRYHEAGLHVIPKRNSLDKVCDALEKNNAVIFVLDQHSSTSGREGIKTEFLGYPAGTYRSPAMIAKFTHVPVMPVRSYRQKNGIHILEFLPRIEWVSCPNESDEIRINTQRYNQVLEQFVLDYPDQWLWMHKRWKAD